MATKKMPVSEGLRERADRIDFHFKSTLRQIGRIVGYDVAIEVCKRLAAEDAAAFGKRKVR